MAMGQYIKGCPTRVAENIGVARLLPQAVDCQDYNAINVAVIALGSSPSFVVEIQESDTEGGNYLVIPDAQGIQAITSNTSFDVIVGGSWVKVNLKSVSTGSATIVVTPYVSPGQPRVSALAVSGGQTAYNTGTGFFMGYDSGVPAGFKLSVGDPSGSYLTWDGSTLTVTGTISGIAGSIGGWTINATYLAKDTGVNATSAGMAPLDYPFYAGATYANRATAPFRVTPAGALTATSATITGSITMTAGSATLGTGDSVLKFDASSGLWLGNAVFASAPFRVSLAGALTATSATITGTITATSGTIGGWMIGATFLYLDTGVEATSSGMAPGSYPFYAGAQFANRATAPFRVTPAGALTATSATITGTITASAGSIGGWTIGATTLTTGAGANQAGMGSYGAAQAFWAGGAAPGTGANFNVGHDGALVAANATITGAITLSSGTISGVVTIGASGGIFQGTGTFASPTTALKIYNSGGVGLLEMWGSGVKQVYFGTDGKFYAGGGVVRLSSDGLWIANNNSLLFRNAADTADILGIGINSSNVVGLVGNGAGGWLIGADSATSAVSISVNLLVTGFSQVYGIGYFVGTGTALSVPNGTAVFGYVPTLPAQTANTIFVGPASGAAAAPTFRAMVNADLPSTLTPSIAGMTITGNPAQLTLTGSVNNSQQRVVLQDETPTDKWALGYRDSTGNFIIAELGNLAANERIIIAPSTGTITVTGIIAMSSYLDLSAIAAGSPGLKITATSDTPTVTWGAGGASHASAAPAGYLEILVGASARYIPFWA